MSNSFKKSWLSGSRERDVDNWRPCTLMYRKEDCEKCHNLRFVLPKSIPALALQQIRWGRKLSVVRL